MQMKPSRKTVMPPRLNLGQHYHTTIGTPRLNLQDKERDNPYGYRSVMGYFLPTWQRGLVWTQEQNIRFLESAWLGLDLGTFTINRSEEYGGPLDNLLIDGQQRMHAIECYLNDEFPVFSYRWSEVTEGDRRRFDMNTAFSSYVLETDDENVLRAHYDRMNFGGTPHLEHQRALGCREEPEQGNGMKL